MPNKYEREIEEILRNLEQTEPRQGLGQKFGERLRRKPAPRATIRERRSFAPRFTMVEWLLCSAVICALIAGGYAYILSGGNTLTGIIACIGFVCLVLVVCAPMLLQRRPRSVTYGNVTVTPMRRGFFSTFRTRWNLFWMRMRYRRKEDKR
jgi:hypothetical protein